MTRFAILLDSGATLPLVKTVLKATAREQVQDWNNRRAAMMMLAEQDEQLPPDERGPRAIPRRAIGLVTYRRKEKR